MIYGQLDLAEVEPLDGGMGWLVPALVAAAQNGIDSGPGDAGQRHDDDPRGGADAQDPQDPLVVEGVLQLEVRPPDQPVERVEHAACVLDDLERVSRAYWGGYGVAKHALRGLASIVHEETEHSSVRTHAILPGPMRTALRRAAFCARTTSIGRNRIEASDVEATLLNQKNGEQLPDYVRGEQRRTVVSAGLIRTE